MGWGWGGAQGGTGVSGQVEAWGKCVHVGWGWGCSNRACACMPGGPQCKEPLRRPVPPSATRPPVVDKLDRLGVQREGRRAPTAAPSSSSSCPCCCCCCAAAAALDGRRRGTCSPSPTPCPFSACVPCCSSSSSSCCCCCCWGCGCWGCCWDCCCWDCGCWDCWGGLLEEELHRGLVQLEADGLQQVHVVALQRHRGGQSVIKLHMAHGGGVGWDRWGVTARSVDQHAPRAPSETKTGHRQAKKEQQ